MPRKPLLDTPPPRGGLPSRKNSELTAAPCQVKCPSLQARAGGGVVGSPMPACPTFLCCFLSLYSSLDRHFFKNAFCVENKERPFYFATLGQLDAGR